MRAEVATATVYPSGELAMSRRMPTGTSRPPRPTYGKRMVRGVSPNGRRQVRRAIVARRNAGPAQFVLLTLTSQDVRSDEEMRRALRKFLMWGRKYAGPWFDWRLWVAEDQQRGVLHFHLLLAKRIPRGLFLRMRALWCDTYGMGPGGVDIEKMRSAKGAAKYLGKYLGKSPDAYRLELDAEGFMEYRPWRVSRHNGAPYVRDRFRGNPYGMSDAARLGTVPVVCFWAPVGAFPHLDGAYAAVRFFETAEDAIGHLDALLNPPGGP